MRMNGGKFMETNQESYGNDPATGYDNNPQTYLDKNKAYQLLGAKNYFETIEVSPKKQTRLRDWEAN